MIDFHILFVLAVLAAHLKSIRVADPSRNIALDVVNRTAKKKLDSKI